MSLPKWATTVTPFSKILALIIFITFPIVSFLLGMKYQYIADKNENIENKISNPSSTIKLTIIPLAEPATPFNITQQPSSTPNENKLYLVKRINGNNINVYSVLPKGSTVVYNNKYEGYTFADVTINNKEYIVNVQLGGAGGPCPMTNNDSTHCGYEDKEIKTMKGVTIEAVRIWKDYPRGIFLLDPWDINIDGKYNINSILVFKKNQSIGFTQDEVDIWLNIFSSTNKEAP